MNKSNRHTSSFRDPSGFIFIKDNTIYRQVNSDGKADYDHFIKSGLYDKLVDLNLLIPHKEIKEPLCPDDVENHYLTLQPQPIPFISYPYEWSFSQIKDAALLTLTIQQIALEHGMILKDASAYNVQFIGKKPIFIDTLSFAIYEAGSHWQGYKQFCEHFIAPLALACYGSPEFLRSLSVFIDGIPLYLVANLLPAKARLKKGLLAHIFIHSRSQKKYQQTTVNKNKQRKLSKLALDGLMSSLTSTTKSLKLKKSQTEWGEYYTFTNYSSKSFLAKKHLVSQYLNKITPKPKLVWDLGANNGEFSELAAKLGAYTVAFDIDPLAVEYGYKKHSQESIDSKVLPLIQDLTNPTSSLGFAHQERMSLISRGPADVVIALALIHHLAISNNLPLPLIADFLHKTARYVIIEFVPKSDSKVQKLLSSRQDIFDKYDEVHFEQAMEEYFKLKSKNIVSGSKRTIYFYEGKMDLPNSIAVTHKSRQ